MNREALFTKLVFVEDTLIATVDLFGHPLVLEHVLEACRFLGTEADQRDDEYQAQFGGKTYFGEFAAAPKPRPGQAGYL
jgi:hypothetical protein